LLGHKEREDLKSLVELFGTQTEAKDRVLKKKARELLPKETRKRKVLGGE